MSKWLWVYDGFIIGVDLVLYTKLIRRFRADRRRIRNRGSAGASPGYPSSAIRAQQAAAARYASALSRTPRTSSRMTAGKYGRLPVRQGTEPFIGYKTMEVLAMNEHTFKLTGAYHPHGYSNPARAECTTRRHGGLPTSVPQYQCTCGFYALKSPYGFLVVGGAFAEVELYGTVIVATDGYRAEWQKVLRLIIPDHCTKCHRDPKFLTSLGQFTCKKHGFHTRYDRPIEELERALNFQVISHREFKKERRGRD